jgi:hypothetical protein
MTLEYSAPLDCVYRLVYGFEPVYNFEIVYRVVTKLSLHDGMITLTLKGQANMHIFVNKLAPNK